MQRYVFIAYREDYTDYRDDRRGSRFFVKVVDSREELINTWAKLETAWSENNNIGISNYIVIHDGIVFDDGCVEYLNSDDEDIQNYDVLRDQLDAIREEVAATVNKDNREKASKKLAEENLRKEKEATVKEQKEKDLYEKLKAKFGQ